jgi:hypothetical protein
VTETVPEPPRRESGDDVESPREHEGDTEDVGAEREGHGVEDAEEPTPW